VIPLEFQETFGAGQTTVPDLPYGWWSVLMF